MIYTSGTTGFPKGAMLTHRNLVTAVVESVIEYQPMPDERNLLAFPLCHVAGYTVPVNHLRGGLVVLMRAYEPELFMQLVERHRITATGLAPTMLNFLLQHPKIDQFDLSALRNIGYGAAAMPVEVLKRAIDRFGPIVYSGFGMTELGGNVLTFTKEAHIRAINGEEHLLASCGTPMCLADVKVVDDHMVECAPGVVGEIVIRGEQVLQGYWRNEEGTQAAFADGWFHTGDMARRDEEGFFYIVDRKKDMIITGGENVYSREVEEVALHPSVGLGGSSDRAARPSVGRERHRRRRAPRQVRQRRERDIIAVCARPAGRLQEAEAGPLRGRAARRTSAARSSSASCATSSARSPDRWTSAPCTASTARSASSPAPRTASACSSPRCSPRLAPMSW